MPEGGRRATAAEGPLTAYRARLATGALAPDSAQEKAAHRLEALAGRLAETRRSTAFRSLFGRGRAGADTPCGLYLWGRVGRGKSMLMDLFHETVRIAPRRRVHFHGFMQEVHAGIAEARRLGATNPVVQVADAIAEGARLLCFDEMEITDITDAMLVGRLFERLFARGVVVVATSNRPPGDLYAGGWNRDVFMPFIALIEDRMEVHALDGPSDHRRHRAARDEVWIELDDPESAVAVDRLWSRLAGCAPEAPLELRVHGRDLSIGRRAGRALRASFAELCGQPRGAAEYLAIARAVDMLLVEGVPVLSHKRHDEARRFVLLIDALYEARTRLAVSAAAAPDALYVEGEGVFAFARTASRLQEMRSADWWAANGGGPTGG